MNLPDGSLPADVSQQSSGTPSLWISRFIWTGCFLALGSVLAIRAALAYSPGLAQFIPETLLSPLSLQNPAPGECHGSGPGGCSSAGMPSCSARSSSCCSMLLAEAPLLTDALYQEDFDSDPDDLPADAAECTTSGPASAAELIDPQASTLEAATSTTND